MEVLQREKGANVRGGNILWGYWLMGMVVNALTQVPNS